MKISVIIPAYNAADIIGKCLDSIINQTYSNIEIIIVNDGSSDDTQSICEQYCKKDKRIILYNNKNRGVSYSRNYGVEKATGDYITFIDSDDYIEANCFEILTNKINKDIDVLRYNFKVIGNKPFNNNLYELANKKIVLNEQNKNSLFKHFLTYEQPIPNFVMLLLIRKDIAKKIKFNEKLTMMEDVDYYVQLFSISKNIFFLDKKLYNYYVNPNSVTNNAKYYRKNIFGIIDTNESIMNRFNNEKNSNIIELINYNHLRLISNYAINSFFNNKKEYNKIVKDLMLDNRFINLLKYIKGTPLKNKILLYTIKFKFNLIQNIYLTLLKIVIKLRNKIFNRHNT